jgi:two-component sensor histidine kinase
MNTDGSGSPRIASFPLVSGQESDAEALTAVIRRLTSALSLPEVMEIVTHAARVILSADGITFVLRDGVRCYYAEEDAIGPLWKGRRFPMSACISGWCMEHGRTVAIPDIYDDERIPQDAYRPTFVKSLAMVPVRQEEPIAALGAYWARPHHASAAELELLQTIANAAALSIAYVQLRETQSRGRWRDLMTGLSAQLSRLPAQLRFSRLSLTMGWLQGTKQISIGLALAAAAFAVRMPLDPLLNHQVPYATFYAAVVLGAIWGGWLAGVTALVAGGFAAHVSFVQPSGTLSFTQPNVGAFLIYALVAGMLLLLTHRLVVTSQREQDLNRNLQLIRRELQHRIKNIIAVAQAIAVQTGRSSTDGADFDTKFTKRLQALAGAQALLDDPKHPTAGLALLIERTLAPFGVGDRLKVVTPSEVRVSEEVAVGLALILNELATNALKYGALTAVDGTVSIDCQQSGDRVSIVWREQDGPAVSPPSRSGFGTRLIRSALPKGFGTAKMDYRPEGVRCRIDLMCAGAAGIH